MAIAPAPPDRGHRPSMRFSRSYQYFVLLPISSAISCMLFPNRGGQNLIGTLSNSQES